MNTLYKVLFTLTASLFLSSAFGQCSYTLDSLITIDCNGGSTGAIYISDSGTVSPCVSPVLAINELMYRPGMNDGFSSNPSITGEYIELIGPAGMDISCYVLTDGDWSITIPSGTTIPADGLFTLGHNASPYAVANGTVYDLDVANCGCFLSAAGGSGILIFTNGGEYLALYDNAGTFMEGVIYGAPSAGNTPPNGASTFGSVINTAGLAGCVPSVTIPGPASFVTAPGGVASDESLIRAPDGSGAFTTQVGGSVNACNVAPMPTYIWSNGASTQDISGLSAGVYNLTITDSAACTITANFTVTEPSAIATIDSLQHENCGAGNGAVFLTASGGTGPYTYLWSNGATTQNITGLSANSFTYTITDNNGCNYNSSATIMNGTTGNLNLVVNDISCNGANDGCITTSITGSTGTLSYLWSNGATTDSLCPLPAGPYSLTLTETIGGSGQNIVYQEAFDAVHGWTMNVPTGVNGADNNFWEVDADEAGQPVGACGAAGGANRTMHITSVFFPTGGAAYDAGGLCGILFCPETSMRTESPVFSTVGQSNLTLAFNYIANGDGLIDNCSVVYSDNGGTTWQVLNNSIKSPVCGSGQGEWAAFSGVLPASCDNNPNVRVGFNWVNNDDGIGTDPSVAIDSVVVFVSGGAQVCSIVVDTVINEPAVLTAVPSTIDIGCAGDTTGAIDLTVAGGTSAYAFLWSNGATTEDLTGLTVNNYCVTVTDNNGCTATTCDTIKEPLFLIPQDTFNICTGDSAQLLINTDVASLTWTPAATLSNDTIANPMATPTVSTTYIVSGTNGGCVMMDSIVVLVGDPDISLAVLTNVACFGDSTGAITTNVSGNLNYIWNTGATTSNLSNLTQGTYVVTASVPGGACQDTLAVTVTAPTSALVVSLANSNDESCVGNDGSATAAVSGGTAAYNFAWNAAANNQTSAQATGLSAGNYTLTVTDAAGCDQVLTGIVINSNASLDTNDIPLVIITGMLDCDLNSIGAMGINTSNNYTYVWSNGDTTQNVNGLAAGPYSVTVTNAGGCTAVQTGTIQSPFVPSLNAFINNAGVTMTSVNTGTSVNVNGGNNQSGIGVTYLWTASSADINFGNDSDHATTAVANTSGSYNLVITATANDSTGCTATDTLLLEMTSEFIGIPEAFTPNGDGVNDLFFPLGLSAEDVIRFRIYNRWSQEVYNGDDLQNGGWDGLFNGVEQPTEGYLFMLEYKLGPNEETKYRKGEVTLIR